MTDLLTRLETESGRELDCEIGIRAGVEPEWYDSYGYMDPAKDAPREHQPYTSSVHAALTLVPEGWFYLLDSSGVHVRMWKGQRQGYDDITALANTPQNAIIIAALKARGIDAEGDSQETEG